ncbi:MAG TPA: DUF4270 domain-containing protein [Bacteroidia bacterium]
MLLSASLAFSLTSCDESSVVGLDVQPENDLLNVSYEDTTTIYTRTVTSDSLITDETLISTGLGLIGIYKDPVFGTSSASMYTQLRLPTNIVPTSFGALPVCDSIILSLVYEGTSYGKKDRKQQKLNVYQLAESMNTANVYYSNKTLNTYPNDLTEANGYVFTPKPLDSVLVLGKKLKPQLRIPMDKTTFGQLLLNSQTTGNLASNANFQSFFDGLYITTENTTGLAVEEGNILHFKMGESLLTVYYHNSEAINNDSLKYDFSLGSVARFNHFEHDFTTAIPDLTTQLATPSRVLNDTVYAQSMAGVKTKLEFPYLMNWLDSGVVAINKAELVIQIDNSAAFRLDTFAAPAALMLFGISDDGSTFAIPDAFEGANYFGGTYSSTTLQYRFNISRYIQQVLNGNRNNNGLYLIASNGAVNANRVVIGGGAPGSKQMKLNITFTKIH